MKKFSTAILMAIMVFAGAAAAKAATYTASDVPRPAYGFLSTSKQADYLADPDKILSRHVLPEVDDSIKATREATGLDVAAVIVEDVDGDVKDFAKELYKNWNMGSRISSDNGVLVVVVKNRGGVGEIYAGPGTLSTLPRTALSKIEQKKMTPHLRNHNYYGTITEAVEWIQKVYADPKGAEAELDAAPSPNEDMNVWWMGGILLACVVIAIVMKLREKKKGGEESKN